MHHREAVGNTKYPESRCRQSVRQIIPMVKQPVRRLVRITLPREIDCFRILCRVPVELFVNSASAANTWVTSPAISMRLLKTEIASSVKASSVKNLHRPIHCLYPRLSAENGYAFSGTPLPQQDVSFHQTKRQPPLHIFCRPVLTLWIQPLHLRTGK